LRVGAAGLARYDFGVERSKKGVSPPDRRLGYAHLTQLVLRVLSRSLPWLPPPGAVMAL
jgi:hypothetical protein